MSASSSPDEKGLPSSSRQDEEAEIVERQLHFPDVKASFFTLFRYATASDFVVIAISTVCALVAGALIPLPSVQ